MFFITSSQMPPCCAQTGRAKAASRSRGVDRLGIAAENAPSASGRPRKLSWRQKIVLMVCGTVFAIGVCEILVRFLLPSPHDSFAHNPVIKQQSNSVDLFEADNELGHRLTGGGLIGVYAEGLVSFDAIASDPRRKGRTVVLNLGDSSTSGWASDVAAGNTQRMKRGERLLSPFQNYKTYADVLAEDSRLYVINAGIPGFTSLQGVQYLKRLLTKFDQLGVSIDAVTVYFGNNDSAWNGNIEDKYLLPNGGFQLQLLRVFDQATASRRVIPRVAPSDYVKSLREIVLTCRKMSLKVILVEPVVPYVWQPGLRARIDDDQVQRQLEDEVLKHLADWKGTKVGDLLAHARDMYQQGLAALANGDPQESRRLFETAREEDYLVPRIKEKHALALRAFAAQENVPLISVQDQIPADDRTYFRDYCHPVEPANRLIAEALLPLVAVSRP